MSGATNQTPGVIGRWLPWLIGGALSLQLFWTDYTHARGLNLEGKAVWGRDFVNLWTGGRLLREDGASALYDLETYRAFLAALFGPLRPHNYSYPPATFPIAELFSFLPYGMALALWLAGTGGLFVWAARSWWPKAVGPVWLALLTPAALMNVWAGHYGFLVGALFLLGWQAIAQRDQRHGGIAFGLMLIKPHLALLVPLALLLRRQWTAVIAATVTVLLVLAVTSALYGFSPWIEWLLGAGSHQASLLDAGMSFYGHMSTSLATAILRFSNDVPTALAAQSALAAAAIALLVVAARRGVSTADLAMLSATGTFLVLPYAFNYDLTVVCIAALRLWADPDATRAERWLAIGGFVSPQIGMLLAPLAIPATPLMLAGLFAAQFTAATRARSVAPEAAAEARSA